VEITAARVAAALGDAAAAVADLLAVADRAAELGLVARGLEARIELAVARLRSGDEARGRAALAELAREADGLGFGLLARRTSIVRPAWPRARGE
jgi:hypothetical protein